VTILSNGKVRAPFVRSGELRDIPSCKAIADANRDALGFLVAAAFVDAIHRSQLLVAESSGNVVGFVRYNHRVRGTETALYDICVSIIARRQGVGRALIAALGESCRLHGRRTIIARCPEDLPANAFYACIGFQPITVEPGRRRRLVCWRLTLSDAS
jgi:ribosomal protein S18 acetylase RimI-like enzyme